MVHQVLSNKIKTKLVSDKTHSDKTQYEQLSTELTVLRGVHLSTKKFVECRESSKDDWPLSFLDDALSEAHKISANSDTATRDKAEGESIIIRLGSFTGDLATSLQVFHAYTVLCPNDVVNSPAFGYLVSIHRSFWESIIVFIS